MQIIITIEEGETPGVTVVQDGKELNVEVVGARIRARRKALGMKQQTLARLAGLSVPTIYYIEKGIRKPYTSTLERIEDALNGYENRTKKG